MTTKNQRNLFERLYDEGKSIDFIAKNNEVSWATVYRIICNRKDFIRDEIDICNYYLNGYSTVEISKKYEVNNHLIGRILEKHNIPRTGVGRRKYSLNEHYFDEIDSPEKSYILGLLYADGSNNEKKYTISISLQENDKDTLEKIRLLVESEKPLEYLDYSNKHDNGYTYKNQYRLLFFSSYMCKTLKEKGVYPNKSLKLEFPIWIDEEYVRHFIRGYFDGDGCVCFSNNGNCIVTITSTESFCSVFKNYIESLLKIHVTITDASCHNGITKVVSISGKNQVKKFLDYIYNDSTIHLERKYKLYKNKYYNFS